MKRTELKQIIREVISEAKQTLPEFEILVIDTNNDNNEEIADNLRNVLKIFGLNFIFVRALHLLIR